MTLRSTSRPDHAVHIWSATVAAAATIGLLFTASPGATVASASLAAIGATGRAAFRRAVVALASSRRRYRSRSSRSRPSFVRAAPSRPRSDGSRRATASSRPTSNASTRALRLGADLRDALRAWTRERNDSGVDGRRGRARDVRGFRWARRRCPRRPGRVTPRPARGDCRGPRAVGASTILGARRRRRAAVVSRIHRDLRSARRALAHWHGDRAGVCCAWVSRSKRWARGGCGGSCGLGACGDGRVGMRVGRLGRPPARGAGSAGHHRRPRRERTLRLGAQPRRDTGPRPSPPGLRARRRVAGDRVARPGRSRAGARACRATNGIDALLRELVVAVDLIGVGVAAGCTPYLATELGAQWSGPQLGSAFRDVLRSCSLGQSFDDSLRALGVRVAPVRPLTETLRTSARLGSPAAPALTRLAADVRADLRRRAEARARTVPVRLCFPLVACVLPAFALLTVVPVVLDGLHR